MTTPEARALASSQEDALQRSARLLVGTIALLVTYVTSRVGTDPGRREESGAAGRMHRGRGVDPGDRGMGPAELVLWAGLGLGMEAERRALEVALRLNRTVGAASSVVAGMIPRALRKTARQGLERWEGRADRERRATESLAAEAVSVALREVVDAVLDRVDVDAVVRRADPDAVAARLDLDRIVDRLDLNAIASRIDPDPLAARVDVAAVVGRLDLAGIARGVLEELQVSEIIRESTGSLAVETVDAVRVRGASADATVSRVVDRLLGRKNGRELGMGVPGGDGRAGRNT